MAEILVFFIGTLDDATFLLTAEGYQGAYKGCMGYAYHAWPAGLVKSIKYNGVTANSGTASAFYVAGAVKSAGSVTVIDGASVQVYGYTNSSGSSSGSSTTFSYTVTFM